MGFDIGYKEEINDNRVSVQRGDKKEKNGYDDVMLILTKKNVRFK